VATEQSERIRAALLRAKVSRQSSNSPTLESTDEPETTRTLTETNFSETSKSAVLETESISTEPSLAELTEESESETPLDEPLEDVETALPLVYKQLARLDRLGEGGVVNQDGCHPGSDAQRV